MDNKQQELELLIAHSNYPQDELDRSLVHPENSPTRRDFLIDIGKGGLVLALGLAPRPAVAQVQFAYDPVYGPRIKGDFEAHKRDRQRTGQRFKFLGIDYDVALDAIVVAAGDGPILDVQDRKVGGPSIWQDHGNGFVSFYTHLDKIILDPQRQYVRTGQYVKRGQSIAKNGTYGGEHVHYGFGRLFSGEEMRPGLRATLWIDPDTLGENNGRPRLYTGNPVEDKTPKEGRIYYRDLVQRVLSEYKGGDLPRGLQSYFETFEKTTLWTPDVVKMLKEHGNYFNEGTYERFLQGFQKMTEQSLAVPVVLTHPIKNPALK